MGKLPATFLSNPRYVSSYSEAVSLMASTWPSGDDISASNFVALYYYSDQADRIIFTNDAIIVIRDGNFKTLNLEDIESTRHKTLGAEDSEEVDHRKVPDGLCIFMHSGEQHIVEVKGASGRIRDAFSIGKVIGTLKRRQKIL